MENEYIQEDYVHSANALFHFMGSQEYLIDALKRRALCPRYCEEDVSYLKIKSSEEDYQKIYVLQKCFCDLPLSTVLKEFTTQLTNRYDLTKKEKKAVPEKTSHPELYGQYALAFSKKWGEKSKLQPIHYLSEEAYCASGFSEMINAVLLQDDVEDAIADTLLNWLCFIKPLRGTMKRIGKIDGNKFDYEIFKNFHDEHEWRYVPFNISINGKHLDNIIANRELIEYPEIVRRVNDKLEKCKDAWLPFVYEDIKYIIVPDANQRVQIINAINDLDSSLFKEQEQLQRSILISKILVLDDIKKDY